MAAKKKDEEEKKKNPKVKIIAAIAVAAVAYKFVLAPKPKAEPPAEQAGAAEKIEEGAVVSLPELTLNLADTGSTRYLRVGVALILEKGAGGGGHGGGIEEELPIASDVIVDVLSGKTYAELAAPGAKTAVKAELSEKVREAFHDEKVARVIFTSFVMQ
jgi:flagellar basal body-associated protein FliL